MNDRTRPGPLEKYAFGLVASAAAGFAFLLPVSAAATPTGSLPIDLEWDAPASCAPSDDIERDVRRLLGDAPIPDSVPPIVARVAIRENSDGTFEVGVRTTSGGEDRERELRIETCEEARHLVAFLLAFLIDPRAHEPSPPVAAPAEKTPPPPSAAPPPPAPPPAPLRPASGERSPRWVVAVLASADIGMLPSASVGGELRTGLSSSSWSIEARAAAWLPRRAESTSLEGAGGEFSLFDAGVLGCLRSGAWDAPSIQVCAGPVLLSLSGEGYGVEDPGSENATFFGAQGEAGFLVALSSRTSLRLGLGALVPFSRPTFAIHGVGSIHRPSAAAARASLGLEVGF